jgi:type II secretory pathway pseudopilin PulG
VPSQLPEGVDADRAHRRYPDAATWTRRVILGILAVLVVLGLANTFGQSPSVSQAQGAAATLRVTAPADLRGGLIFQVRVDITAHQPLAKPRLVFSPAWFEAMTLNSLAPQPSTESTQDGAPAFGLSPIPAGQRATYWFYFQVNPTNVGWRRTENLTLLDDTTSVATIHRTITIYP